MISCRAEYYLGAILVTFEDKSTLLLQLQSDQEAFLEACGKDSPDYVTECPDDYYDLAE